jgi:hypothetical protein
MTTVSGGANSTHGLASLIDGEFLFIDGELLILIQSRFPLLR